MKVMKIVIILRKKRNYDGIYLKWNCLIKRHFIKETM